MKYIEVWVESAELVNVVVRVGVVLADNAVDVVRKKAAAAEYITVVCQTDGVVALKRASSQLKFLKGTRGKDSRKGFSTHDMHPILVLVFHVHV